MGFSISWLAVRGSTQEAILTTLQLTTTGEHEEVPESPFAGGMLAGGWFLIFANDFDFAERAPLAALSAGAEVVTCGVEEHVMASYARGLRDGAAIWSISHDSELGLRDLQTRGELPPAFTAISQRLTAMQDEEDRTNQAVDYIFDVPVDVALAVAGYRHDHQQYDPPAGYERFVRRQYR